jgi:hypothetical protein
MDNALPQTDTVRDRYRKASEGARNALNAAINGRVDGALAQQIVASARNALGALLQWHRGDDADAPFAELLRRTENLAAPVATPARVIATVERLTGRDSMSVEEREVVRSAAFTLRNLIETVGAHLPADIRDQALRSHPPKSPAT